MSLIPYQSRDGREIVLRHQNAVVVRDAMSQRLEIQRAECPTCHQPIPRGQSNFVDPEYFRMLRTGLPRTATQQPPSPIRRLTQPIVLAAVPGEPDESSGLDFESNAPVATENSRIRREAFSPNYFNTFFIEERELGRGGRGVVILVRHEIDGCHLGHFACKRVPVGDDHAWLEKVLVEVTLLAKLSHPNLVSYRHVWLEDVQLTRFGPRVACAFILQLYCNGGDLLHYITGNQQRERTKEDLKAQMRRRSKGHADSQGTMPEPLRRLPFEEIFSLFRDITCGLAYLHGANYVHRDLKPSNCLLHREGGTVTCLISDFGEVQAKNAVRKSTGSTGTISYCAPEVLKQDSRGMYGNFTTKSDVFSLGMILYFLCFHRLPYHSANAVHEELEDVDILRAEIVGWKGFKFERRERPDLPSKLFHLLQRLLALNPSDRPSAVEVLGAMSSDPSMHDTFIRPKVSGGPALGLPVQRIQNLGSPVSPSTPAPDISKSPRLRSAKGKFEYGSSSLEALDSPDELLGSTMDGQASIKKKSISALEEAPRPAAESPPQCPPEIEALVTPIIATGLLMPPPTTWTGEIRQFVGRNWFYAGRFLGTEAESLSSSIRLGLFVFKIVTLLQPCHPFTVKLSVSLPLFFMAGVDLSRWAARYLLENRQNRNDNAVHPGIRPWLLSAILLGLHLVVINLASRWDVLCAADYDDEEEEWRVTY